MANTTSLAFPNMFDPVHNRVNTLEDSNSIVNRTRLLMLTDPTSLYNEPNQGVGLRRFKFQYNTNGENNTENQKAKIRDLTVEQLRIHEPCVVPDETQWADGLLFTGRIHDNRIKPNTLEMTIALRTIYDSAVEVDLNSDVNSQGGL